MNRKILIPIVIIVLLYLYFCARSIFWKDSVRYLPNWLWMVICLVSVPLGGVIYYFVGREG